MTFRVKFVVWPIELEGAHLISLAPKNKAKRSPRRPASPCVLLSILSSRIAFDLCVLLLIRVSYFPSVSVYRTFDPRDLLSFVRLAFDPCAILVMHVP